MPATSVARPTPDAVIRQEVSALEADIRNYTVDLAQAFALRSSTRIDTNQRSVVRLTVAHRILWSPRGRRRGTRSQRAEAALEAASSESAEVA